MRVAALIDTYDVSGPGRQLVSNAQTLRERGVRFLVVVFLRAGRGPAPFTAYLADAGVEYVVVPEHGPADLGVVRRTGDALAAFGPDVVETHGYKPSTVAALLRASGRASWRWLAFFHGATTENWKVRAYHWFDRRVMPRADLMAVMSLVHRQEFARVGDRVRVLHNAAVPLPRPADAPVVDVRAAFPTPPAPDEPILGVVGRLSSEKGVDVFLAACARLVADGVPFRAVVAGDGTDRKALVALAAELGLAGHVAFLGPVRDVVQVYEQVDCLVIPSRSEGLPNVLFEALWHDVPVVSTRVGAVPEVLTDPRAGVIVPPQNPDALAAGIVRGIALRRDPAAAAARAATIERFSLNTRADAHQALYAELTTAVRARAA